MIATVKRAFSNKKKGLIEVIEDSPYKFLNMAPPTKLAEFKPLNPKNETYKSFKEVYGQFLSVLA